jgi:hypothetical protein
MTFHDPREFVRGLQQILVSDSKKISFLAGAGTSMVGQRPTGDSLVPGTVRMTKEIVDTLKAYDDVFKLLKKELDDEKKQFTLENVISKINQKELVVAGEKLCGLNRDELKKLREEIEKLVHKLVSVHEEKDFHDWDIIHYKFIQWINDANRKKSIELFTTNYDYLFEIAFERYNIPFFDGFIGSYQPFFSSDSVEDDHLLDKWPKLWKIHGSLGWDYDIQDGKIIKAERNTGKIIVYPSILKYDKSKKQPFISYLDRLSRFVRTDDSILFITGYSFGDDHINDAILTSLGRSKNSSVIVFLFDDFLEDSAICKLAKNQTRLSIYGKRKAVIGGKYGEWKLKSEPAEDEIELLDGFFIRDIIDILDGTGAKVGTKPGLVGDFKLVGFIELVNWKFR